jgi:hypothetical protein
MTAEMNIPDGDHETVLLGEHRDMIETWSEVTVDVDARVMQAYGQDEGRALSEVVPTIAYAHIAKAAFSLSSAADICSLNFDPSEFGARCAEIAREQVTRCREELARSDDPTAVQPV